VNTKGSKGRPPGSSQFADIDPELLKQMYLLCKEGLPVTTAAKRVVEAQDWTPIKKTQAVDRLRKEKFKKFRAEKEKALPAMEKALPATRPTPRTGHSHLAPVADQVRQAVQAVKFIGPSGVKAIKEYERWVRENKDAIREAVEIQRSLLKRQT
jgi:hypothetical protein